MEVYRAAGEGDLVELDAREDVAVEQIGGRHELPVALARLQPLEIDLRVLDVDALDVDAALQQALQRHVDGEPRGGGEFLGIHAVGAGHAHVLDRQARPGEQPRGDGTFDDHVAARQLLAIGLEIGAIGIPVDDEGRHQQAGDDDDQHDAEVEHGRRPHRAGPWFLAFPRGHQMAAFLPGFMMFFGSSARLMSRMKATAGPCSFSR